MRSSNNQSFVSKRAASTNQRSMSAFQSSEAYQNADADFEKLLKEQEAFVRSSDRPAAKVTRMKGSTKPPPEQETLVESSFVMKDVMERHTPHITAQSIQIKEPSGFPQALRMGKTSVFGRRKQEVKLPQQDNSESGSIIAAMSPEEIKNAKKEIRDTLKSEDIDFLMRRKGRSKATEKESTESVAGGANEFSMDMSKGNMEKELDQNAHVTPEERAKLEWMKPLNSDTDQAMHRVRKTNSAQRFDFNGETCGPAESDKSAVLYPTHSGLYHHGEDPDQPGYTIKELEHLARSRAPSQRAAALEILARILYRCQRSPNSNPISIPTTLSSTIRAALDDSNQNVLSAAVGAMHALIVPCAIGINTVLEGSLEHLQGANLLFEIRTGIIEMGPIRCHTDAAASIQAYPDIELDTEPEDGTNSCPHPTAKEEELLQFEPIQLFIRSKPFKTLALVLQRCQAVGKGLILQIIEILSVCAQRSVSGARAIAHTPALLDWLDSFLFSEEAVDNLAIQADTSLLVLCYHTLRLIRILSQAERSVAVALIEIGLIHKIKGILAVESRTEVSMLAKVECLRIWRVFLGFQLDFHCFSYLYTILIEFMNHAMRRRTEETECVMQQHLLIAIFAAMEAFCGLDTQHEAQHYIGQLPYFITIARELALRELAALSRESDPHSILLLSTSLRFLAAACGHATKYHFAVKDFSKVFDKIRSSESLQYLHKCFKDAHSPYLHHVQGDLLLAVLRYHAQFLQAQLEHVDQDAEELQETFVLLAAPIILSWTKTVLEGMQNGTDKPNMHWSATEVMYVSISTDIQATESILELTRCLMNNEKRSHRTSELLFANALAFIERLKPGTEALAHQLLSQVINTDLQMYHDEPRAHQALLAAYQALIHIRQEEAEQLISLLQIGRSGRPYQSYHLHVPQTASSYVASNLPLPPFWMYAPFSRMQYLTTNELDTGVTKAIDNDNVRWILTACCRFLAFKELRQFEYTAPKVSILDEEKLVHVMHTFFISTEIFFDAHFQKGLQSLLVVLTQNIFCRQTKQTIHLFGAMENILQHFSDMDPEKQSRPDKTMQLVDSQKTAELRVSQQRATAFVEQFVHEFTATSFGNLAFAHCATLLFHSSFPLETRKWTWKQLMDARMLDRLDVLEETVTVSSSGPSLKNTIFQACVVPLAVDEEWARYVKTALCSRLCSPSQDSFAYALSIHILVHYLFQNDLVVNPPPASTEVLGLTSARQALVEELLNQLSVSAWLHVLQYVYNGTLQASASPLTQLSAEIAQSPPNNAENLQTLAILSFGPNQTVHQRLNCIFPHKCPLIPNIN